MQTLLSIRGKFNYYLTDEGVFRFPEALSELELRKKILTEDGELAADCLESEIKQALKREGERDYRAWLDWQLFQNRAGENSERLDPDDCIEAYLQ